MNKCVLIGNLCADPELSETKSGVAVCKFNIAVNRQFANSNGERETDFINIVAWRGQAENCGKYLHKGSKVAVCGSIQTSNYEDKSGNKRPRTFVNAENVEFLGGNDKNASVPKETAQTGNKKQISDMKPIDNDDLPF